MDSKTTGEVATLLGTSEPRLSYLMRHKKCPKPVKKVGRIYQWNVTEIAAARLAVKNNPEPKK